MTPLTVFKNSFAFPFLWLLLLSQNCQALAFDSGQWQEHMSAGNKALEAASYGEAERQFQEAFTLAKSLGENDGRLGDTFAALAGFYTVRGQEAKAQNYYEKALKIKDAGLGKLAQESIELRIKLIQFLLSHNRTDRAIDLSDTLCLFGQTEVNQLINVNNSFQKLAAFYQKHPKYLVGAARLKEAETATVRLLNEQAQENAVRLDAVGVALKDLSDEKSQREARILCSSALGLRQRVLPAGHAAIAQSMENLGRIYLKQGNLAQAQLLLEKAYEISGKTLGFERRETHLRLEALALVYSAQGQYGKAEALYRRLFELAAGLKGQIKLGPDRLALFASLLMKEGKYQEASTFYARAIKLQESLNGPQHSSLAALLESYAYSLNKANRSDEAKKIANRARQIKGAG